MRILYVGQADLSGTYGPNINEREFVTTASALEEADVTWRFLCPRPQGGLPPGIASRDCRLYSGRRRGQYAKWLVEQVSVFIALGQEVRAFQPDLVVARLGLLPVGVVLQFWMRRSPVVLRHAPDGLFPEFGRVFLLSGVLRWFARGLLRVAAANALRIEFVSRQQLTNALRTWCGRPEICVWIDNAVNTERFVPRNMVECRRELGLMGFSHVAGYVGNYPWRRGGKVLVDALGEVTRDVPGLGLVILGDDGDRARLMEHARSLGLAERCVFPGKVAFEDVAAFIGACDVLVSLREGLERRESELKIRQYLACGRPVIVTEGGSDFVEAAGLGTVLRVADGKRVADALQYWLAVQDSSGSRIAEKARAYAVEHLSYGQALQARLRCWRALLGGQES